MTPATTGSYTFPSRAGDARGEVVNTLNSNRIEDKVNLFGDTTQQSSFLRGGIWENLQPQGL